MELLAQWYPKINAFEAKLKPYDEQFRILRENETVLRGEAERAKWERDQEHREGLDLIQQLREYQDFMDSIPEEVLVQLRERYEQGQREGQVWR